MRLAIVNRFCPPDPSMTGRMAMEMAIAMRRRFPSWPITIVCTDRAYRAARIEPIADSSITVRRIASRSFGAGRVGRLAGSLLDGRALARTAFELGDVVIALTDPPLLGYWIGRRARRTQAKWVEWTMDLYPDAFAAAGLARPDGPAHRAIIKALGRHPPDIRLALGPGQARHLDQTRGPACLGAFWPAGILAGRPAGDWRAMAPAPPGIGEPVHIGYVGNIGEAHSLEAIARVIELAPPDRFRFTLAPSGGGAVALRRRVGERPHVTVTAYLDEAELSSFHVHLISLRDDWAHVSVPSKAVTAIMAGSPFLFAGPERSDTWTMLGAAGWRLPADGGTNAEIRGCLDDLAKPGAWRARQVNAERLARELSQTRDVALDALCTALNDWDDDRKGPI